jgi:hypothetical protein
MVLMLVHVAHGAIAAIRAGVSGEAQTPVGEGFRLPRAARVMEVISGVLVLLTLGVPVLMPLLPAAVLVALAAALVAGHLSWRQAIVVVGALLVAFLAYLQIQFPLPLLSEELNLLPQAGGAPNATGMRALAAAILLQAVVLGVMLGLARRRGACIVLTALTVFAGCFFVRVLFTREMAEGLSKENTALVEVADWARRQTPAEALFLTPAGTTNFRIFAERSVVGDWRDGTQIYFSAAFGPPWLERVSNIEPGLTLTQDGRSVLLRDGKSLEALDDATLVDLAEQYNADYILLKTPAANSQTRTLVKVYSDEHYIVYEPTIEPAPVPPGVFNANLWAESEKFMDTTVAQNIEMYRKADVTFQVVDTAGHPVQNLAIKADQTKQAFNFGVSLGFFEANNLPANGDLKPVPVRPIELQKAPEIFNASMIPFSSKWQYIEPTKGKYNWSDLDKYVDYATKNGMALEFHHLTGVLPDWVEQMGGVGGQTGLSFSKPIPAVQTEFNRHCFDTVARYADRVKYWQVVNEKYMMQYVPPVFKELQKRYPNNQFGLSDCVRFWDGTNGAPITDTGGRGRARLNGVEYKGADAVDWLIAQGIHPDFFSIHGHWPMDLWADPREMYNVINYFQDRKVRVHITEEYLQLGGPIFGPIRSGTLTPALQGELLERFFTIAFSHPDVDLVNYWGLAPNGWGASSSGLIDATGQTRPAWDVLKKLFTETWRSHASGELSLDGTYLARVFHGSYAVTVTLPSGKQVTANVEVPQQPTAQIRMELDAEQGSLKVIK